MSTLAYDPTIIRPPFVLDFTDSGRLVFEFPTQHPMSQHGSVNTSLSGGAYTVTFPASTVVTIPSGNIQPTVNGEEIDLDPSCGLIINLLRGGTITTPSGQTDGVLLHPKEIQVDGFAASVTAASCAEFAL